MSESTPRMRKEARALFLPWCGAVILCALPLFHVNHTLAETSVAFCYLAIPMLATAASTAPAANSRKARELLLLMTFVLPCGQFI